MLHVYDPKALHSILIKDVEQFPHDVAPSKCVLTLFVSPTDLTLASVIYFCSSDPAF